MLSHKNKSTRWSAFSLIELVIVVVIIAIIGAIAIPRMSRGAAGASDSALTGDLNILRSAIDMYASEHNGTFPALSTIGNQLLEYTDDSGNTATAQDSTHVYGPYLRTVPTLPLGPSGYKGASSFVDGSSGTAGTAAGAWFYNATIGTITANLDNTQTDARGVAYNSY